MPSADSVSAAVRPDAPHADHPARRKLTAGGAAIAVIALSAITLAHPSATRMHTWPWALVSALLWLLPVAWLGTRIAIAKSLRLPPPMLTIGLCLLAVAAVISAWASPFAAASLARSWPTLGGIALVFLLHDGLSVDQSLAGPRTTRLAQIVSLVGAAVIVASLAGWWREGGLSRNTIPFGHSTYTGGATVLLLPWFALRACATRALSRLTWIALVVATLVVLLSTSSRGAVLALGAVGSAAVIAALFISAWSRTQKLLLVVAALGLLVAVTTTNPRLRELVRERRWGDSARESNRQRSAMFAAGLQLGAERPALGWGPGTVPLAYPRVRATLDGGVENVLQLHNTPVQIWATLGFAGIISLALLALGTAQALLSPAQRAVLRQPLILTSAASLGGYVLFSLTDHQFDLPFFAALAASNLAVLSASGQFTPARLLTRKRRWILLLVGAALIAGPALSRARNLLAARAYEQGLVAWEAGRSADFLVALARAERFAPHDAFFAHQAAGELLRAAEISADADSRQQLTRTAIARLEGSLASGGHEEFAHFNLGWLYLDTGEASAAARHFAAAARFVPDKGGVYFGLGLALHAAGRNPDAVRAFALEWINDPRQLTSPAWEVPVLAALRPAIYAEALRLYAELRPQHPDAARAEAWTRWWQGESVQATELGAGFTREGAHFAAVLIDVKNRGPIAVEARWAKLYAAWRDRDFGPIAQNDANYAAALARRARRYGTDFRAFVAADTGDESALMRTYRRQRTGYGVLALHPDGPVLADVYVVQENRLVADFAAALFPSKGWLPGLFLLAWLPSDLG